MSTRTGSTRRMLAWRKARQTYEIPRSPFHLRFLMLMQAIIFICLQKLDKYTGSHLSQPRECRHKHLIQGDFTEVPPPDWDFFLHEVVI